MEASTHSIATPAPSTTSRADQSARPADERALPQLGLRGIIAVWAAAAVPMEFIDRTSLLGPVDRIAARMRDYAAAGVTTLSVSLFVGDVDDGIRTLRAAAQALDTSGVGE